MNAEVYSKQIYKIFSSNQPLEDFIYPIETEIRFLCQPGFEIIGQSHATCILNGLGATWNNPLPICKELVYCELINPPENGQIKAVNTLNIF